MSENITKEDLQYYVDWESLRYYDDRIKSFISQQGSLSIGGSKHSCWFEESPLSENLNKLFYITDEFVTNSVFVTPDVVCGPGSVVYLDNTSEGLKYRVLVKMPECEKDETSDYNNILEKVLSLTEEVHQNSRSVERIDNDLDNTNDRITSVVVQLQSTEHSIHDIIHSHEGTFATKLELQSSLQELESKLENIPDGNYATEEFVRNIVDSDVKQMIDDKIEEAIESGGGNTPSVDYGEF